MPGMFIGPLPCNNNVSHWSFPDTLGNMYTRVYTHEGEKREGKRDHEYSVDLLETFISSGLTSHQSYLPLERNETWIYTLTICEWKARLFTDSCSLWKRCFDVRRRRNTTRTFHGQDGWGRGLVFGRTSTPQDFGEFRISGIEDEKNEKFWTYSETI